MDIQTKKGRRGRNQEKNIKTNKETSTRERDEKRRGDERRRDEEMIEEPRVERCRGERIAERTDDPRHTKGVDRGPELPPAEVRGGRRRCGPRCRTEGGREQIGGRDGLSNILKHQDANNESVKSIDQFLVQLEYSK